MRRLVRLLCLAAAAAASLFLMVCGRVDRPKLVVFIVVDQMREDTFDRFGDLFEGGFRRLSETGVYFSETRHAHAYTATSSGHFSIAMARHPGTAGVTGNHLYDREARKKFYCVDDAEGLPLSGGTPAYSYRRISHTALPDWLRKASPESKVFSVSVKGHAAVPLGGREADGVFWFDYPSGTFVSSDYYMSEYPEWLLRFNESGPADRFFGTTWSRFLDDPEAYPPRSREDEFFAEAWDEENGGAGFPHPLPQGPPGGRRDYNLLKNFPWLDEVTLDLALEILAQEGLGEDRYTDMLMISFSAPDLVGHRYGPYSQESMDTFLRLDGHLDRLLDAVRERVGIGETLFVLTSDHGCSLLPEYARALGMDGGRIARYLEGYTDILDEACSGAWGPGEYIEVVSNNSIYYDRGTMAERGVTAPMLDSLLVPLILREAWAGAVYTRGQILSDGNLDPWGELWRNQFHPEYSGDLFVTPAENYIIWKPVGTTHEDAHDYNRHVPFLLAGAGLEPGIVEEPVATVDIAPTVARILHIPIPRDVDGKGFRFR